MFWIIVLTVAVIGAVAAWWLSGRAPGLDRSTAAHQRRLDGGGGNHFQNPTG